MKLVLASQGFTTSEIANQVAELASKKLGELAVAVINEAYTGIVPARNHTWMINEFSNIAKYTNGPISFVNLRAYPIDEIEKRLAFADLIYIVGGAQLVLPQLFVETGFDKLLIKLAQQKVIMGTSAGANVLGSQINDATYWQDQYGSSSEYLANPPFGLVNFNILPHFTREDHPRRNTEVLTPLLLNNPFPIYGVTDTQAVIFDNGQTIFIGGKPAIFGLAA